MWKQMPFNSISVLNESDFQQLADCFNLLRPYNTGHSPSGTISIALLTELPKVEVFLAGSNLGGLFLYFNMCGTQRKGYGV